MQRRLPAGVAALAPVLALLLSAEAAEDGPNLLVRGGPVVLIACIALGVWLAMRRRR